MEHEELILKLSTLPGEIRDSEEGLLALVEAQEKMILKKDLIEMSTALDIENSTIDGKKLFTNELKRKAAADDQLRDNKEYQAILQGIKDARHEIKMLEITLSYKKRLFSSIESTIKIIRP
jgi:hypothetical protein